MATKADFYIYDCAVLFAFVTVTFSHFLRGTDSAGMNT